MKTLDHFEISFMNKKQYIFTRKSSTCVMNPVAARWTLNHLRVLAVVFVAFVADGAEITWCWYGSYHHSHHPFISSATHFNFKCRLCIENPWRPPVWLGFQTLNNVFSEHSNIWLRSLQNTGVSQRSHLFHGEKCSQDRGPGRGSRPSPRNFQESRRSFYTECMSCTPAQTQQCHKTASMRP